MKESTNKTAGRTQTGQNKSATKSSRTTGGNTGREKTIIV